MNAVNLPANGVWLTLDGPSGVGKTAQSLMTAILSNSRVLSLGLLYRAVTLDYMEGRAQNEVLQDPKTSLKQFQFEFGGTRARRFPSVTWRGRQVFQDLHGPNVLERVSEVATREDVRTAVCEFALNLASCGRWIAEGRSAGRLFRNMARTHLYLTAAVDERKARTELAASLRRRVVRLDPARDSADATRAVDPFRQERWMTTLDTSSQSPTETLALIAACTGLAVSMSEVASTARFVMEHHGRL